MKVKNENKSTTEYRIQNITPTERIAQYSFWDVYPCRIRDSRNLLKKNYERLLLTAYYCLRLLRYV